MRQLEPLGSVDEGPIRRHVEAGLAGSSHTRYETAAFLFVLFLYCGILATKSTDLCCRKIGLAYPDGEGDKIGAAMGGGHDH